MSIFLLATLISMPIIGTAQASIQTFTWLPPYVIRGSETMFYQTYIVGYKTGETASLQVLVDTYLGYPYYGYRPTNVSAVKIWFDWDINYTSTEASIDNPIQIPAYQTRIFTINFTVPSTTVASNFVAHTYTIYVEYVNATTGPKRIVGTMQISWNSVSPSYRFAVYSADQADVMDLVIKYQSHYSAYPPTPTYFTSIQARLFAGQAVIEATTGSLRYTRGNVTGAKIQYQTALNLYEKALSTERDWGTTTQAATLNLTKVNAEAALKNANAAMTEANAAMIVANATMYQSYAWLLFGIGFIIISIGVFVYAAKKPRIP